LRFLAEKQNGVFQPFLIALIYGKTEERQSINCVYQVSP
jgi:hypothetical protein